MSNLFCGIFLFFLDSYQQKRLKPSHLLLILFLTQVIWVNMHIFFILGPLLTVLFLFQAYFNKEKEEVRFLGNLFLLLLVACLINPSGLKGLLLPLKNYTSYFSYPILENYPVLSLLKIEFLKPVIFYFLFALGLLGLVLVLFIKKEGLKQNVLFVVLALIISLATMKANPFKVISRPSVDNHIGKSKIINEAEARKLLSAPLPYTIKGKRARAILSLLPLSRPSAGQSK